MLEQQRPQRSLVGAARLSAVSVCFFSQLAVRSPRNNR